MAANYPNHINWLLKILLFFPIAVQASTYQWLSHNVQTGPFQQHQENNHINILLKRQIPYSDQSINHTENLSDLIDITITQHSDKNIIINHAEIIHSITHMMQQYQQLLQWPFQKKINPHITIFYRRKEFEDYQIKKLNRLISLYGYYSPLSHEAVILAGESKQATLKLILHEVSHAITYTRLQRIPTWLNEGLAEYFSHQYIQKQSSEYFKPITVPFHQTYIQKKLLSNNIYSITDFTREEYFKRDSTSANQRALHYRLSLSLINFLLHDQHHQKILINLLDKLDKRSYFVNYDNADIIELFYPGGSSNLSNDWINWIYNYSDN